MSRSYPRRVEPECSTIIFSVVNAPWLRPLPFDDPGRLVWVANRASENLSRQAVQVGHVVDLREQSRSLIDLAGFSPSYSVGDIRLTGTGEFERVTAVPVTEGFFPLLGVRRSALVRSTPGFNRPITASVLPLRLFSGLRGKGTNSPPQFHIRRSPVVRTGRRHQRGVGARVVAG